MIKFSFLIRRLPGLSAEDFVNYHKNHHAPLFKSLPASQKYVKKYVITHAFPLQEGSGLPEPKYDGLTELWFDNLQSLTNLMLQMTQSPICAQMSPDL